MRDGALALNSAALLVALAGMLLSAPGESAPADGYRCLSGDLVRRVEVHFQNPAAAPPCSVRYFRDVEEPGRVQVLWRARNDVGYCRAKAASLVARLRTWGWACHQPGSEKQLPPLTTAARETHANETVTPEVVVVNATVGETTAGLPLHPISFAHFTRSDVFDGPIDDADLDDPNIASYLDKHGAGSFESQYIQMRDHPDEVTQSKINSFLKKVAATDDSAVYLSRRRVTTQIIEARANRVTFAIEESVFPYGAPRSGRIKIPVNLDLRTGKPFGLRDLFRAGFENTLNAILKQNPPRCAAESPPTIGSEQYFYIQNEQIVLVWNPHEICADTSGVVEITIPADKLRPFVDPKGPVGYWKQR